MYFRDQVDLREHLKRVYCRRSNFYIAGTKRDIKRNNVRMWSGALEYIAVIKSMLYILLQGGSDVMEPSTITEHRLK